MPIEITIPRLGWSMEEGNFVGWLKKDGETVKVGDMLFTLESEKASQDIEATDSGILRIPADSPQPGTVVQVGQVIGLLLGENEKATNIEPLQKSPEKKPETAEALPKIIPTVTAVDGKIAPISDSEIKTGAPASSPRARRRAAELGVDSSYLKGSGRTGRVVEADVLKAAKSDPSAPSGGISTMRRTIAQRTAMSFATAPHFYLRSEVDVTALLELRSQLLPEIERTTGVRLTLTDLLLRAQALALRDFPFVNAVWQDGNIVAMPGRDVGLVVGLPDGLIIPIVRSVDTGSLALLAKQRASLVADAKAGKLAGDALQGGATSLSNLGNSLVDEFTAVLPPPHSTILAVGRAKPRPFSSEGWIGLRTTLKLCLSVDHRVMDGGPAGEYLGRIIEILEKPKQLVEDK